MIKPINYLQPDVPGILPWHKLETITATNKSLKGYGCLVSKGDYETFPIEIVQWPKPKGRKVDSGTGNQAGTKEGIFDCWWEGEVLFGKNDAIFHVV